MDGEQPRWLEGRRILITGAAGMLGGELVAEAVRQGALVAATGRAPTIDEASFPEGVRVLPADLADPAACGDLPRRAAEALGGLDVLVNNAAVLIRSLFMDLRQEDLDLSWAVNARAPALLIIAAVPYLEQGVRPSIINVVSTGGVSGGIAPVSAYAMTKAALIVLSKALARELGPRGIRVNCLSPGTMDSQMQRALDDETRRKVRAMNVIGRPLEVREIARATLFLASEHAAAVTGTMLDATATVP
ncbi:MAG: SDR family oxidoreductase [Chloroflexota bacterium]|nr:SDR family oxidoreductase [Chloroflexota bacterium]